MNVLEIAKKVFSIEKDALQSVSERLDANFENAVKILLNLKGRIIVCGMGKSGLIGKKIAATFSSIGRPSFFIHPSEAIHGDLGILMKEDCFLSISNSGETDELLQLIPHIKRLNLPHISLTGIKKSTLARHADFVLDIGVTEEASNLQAVPMASALTALAMGDALAAVLIELTAFRQEDFALYHPGGSLGRKLLTKVSDIMQQDNMPLLDLKCRLKEILTVMSKGSLGLAVVSDDKKKVLGIITDGDLRRAMEKSSEESFFELKAENIMSPNPKTIRENAPLLEAEELMNQHKITSLLVTENELLKGIISKQMFR